VLPDVHATLHTPTGRVGAAANAAGAATPFLLNGASAVGLNFNLAGNALVPFAAGTVVGAATSNQSGGPEAAIANQAFNVPVYAAEVVKRSFFAGLTFDANDSTRFMMNVFGWQTESNDYDQRGMPHLSGIWNGRVYATNPYLPASVRQAMDAQGVDSFILQKQGTVVGMPGNWNDDEERHNQFDSWTLQLGIDKNTVYKYLQDGSLPGLQLGRKWLVSERRLADFLERVEREQTSRRRDASAGAHRPFALPERVRLHDARTERDDSDQTAKAED